jgi:hypothetical protein
MDLNRKEVKKNLGNIFKLGIKKPGYYTALTLPEFIDSLEKLHKKYSEEYPKLEIEISGRWNDFSLELIGHRPETDEEWSERLEGKLKWNQSTLARLEKSIEEAKTKIVNTKTRIESELEERDVIEKVLKQIPGACSKNCG